MIIDDKIVAMIRRSKTSVLVKIIAGTGYAETVMAQLYGDDWVDRIVDEAKPFREEPLVALSLRTRPLTVQKAFDARWNEIVKVASEELDERLPP